jgi:hypothetical protein
MPADAGGEVGRTDAVARFTNHELLHGTVLERVERDDREPATGTERAHRGVEAALQVLELAVDGDAERLEDPRRGIDAPTAALLDPEHEPAEVVGGHERLARAPPHDSGRDPSGLGLLAVLGEDATELALIPAVHDVGRRDGKVGIGAHVQRAFRAEAEASRGVGELDRRETEIEEDTVERVEIVFVGHDVTKREVGAGKDRAASEAREDATGFGERRGVDIEPEKTSIRRGAFEDGLGMASPTHRAVEEAATFAGIKLGEYFGQKNRLMKPPSFVATLSSCSSFIARPRDP